MEDFLLTLSINYFFLFYIPKHIKVKIIQFPLLQHLSRCTTYTSVVANDLKRKGWIVSSTGKRVTSLQKFSLHHGTGADCQSISHDVYLCYPPFKHFCLLLNKFSPIKEPESFFKSRVQILLLRVVTKSTHIQTQTHSYFLEVTVTLLWFLPTRKSHLKQLCEQNQFYFL